MKNTYSTQVGLLALWDSNAFTKWDSNSPTNINTLKKYQANFTNDDDILSLMNEGGIVVWGTGSNGEFEVTIKINPEIDLSEEELVNIEKKVTDLRLSVTSSRIYVGTTECVGAEENQATQEGLISLVDGLEQGNYLVNLYLSKSGFIVVLKKTDDNHVFPLTTELPRLV